MGSFYRFSIVILLIKKNDATKYYLNIEYFYVNVERVNSVITKLTLCLRLNPAAENFVVLCKRDLNMKLVTWKSVVLSTVIVYNSLSSCGLSIRSSVIKKNRMQHTKRDENITDSFYFSFVSTTRYPICNRKRATCCLLRLPFNSRRWRIVATLYPNNYTPLMRKYRHEAPRNARRDL